MDIKKRTLTATEESVLKNDLLDVEVWVNGAIDGKVANCKKRMIAEWLPKLYADDSVDSIPALTNTLGKHALPWTTITSRVSEIRLVQSGSWSTMATS